MTAPPSRSSGAEARPLPRPAPRWAVIGVFLFMCVYALAYGRDFLMPVVLALMLTLVFSPMRRTMGRWGIAPGIAAGMITGTLLVGLVAMLLSLASPARSWVEDAPKIGREVEEKLRSLRGAAEGVRQAAEEVDKITSGAAGPEGEGQDRRNAAAQAAGGETGSAEAQSNRDDGQVVVVERSGGSMVNAALAAPVILGQIVFTLVMLFFLLASGDMFHEKIVHSIPRFKDKRRAVTIARDIERKLSRYLFTITVINAGLGVAIGLAMWILGMPNPVLFGVIGFLFNYVPYLGAIVGVCIAFAVGLVTFVTVEMAALAAAVYFVLTSIEGQLITPHFVGRSLRLNTVVVFISVTFWAWLWSVVGMLVATPLLVAARTLCEHIPSLEGVGYFLSARGAERRDEGGDLADGEKETDEAA